MNNVNAENVVNNKESVENININDLFQKGDDKEIKCKLFFYLGLKDDLKKNDDEKK